MRHFEEYLNNSIPRRSPKETRDNQGFDTVVVKGEFQPHHKLRFLRRQSVLSKTDTRRCYSDCFPTLISTLKTSE